MAALIFAILSTIMILVLPIITICYGNWIITIFVILTGDKQTLLDNGNLCEKLLLPTKQDLEWENRWKYYDGDYSDGKWQSKR